MHTLSANYSTYVLQIERKYILCPYWFSINDLNLKTDNSSEKNTTLSPKYFMTDRKTWHEQHSWTCLPNDCFSFHILGPKLWMTRGPNIHTQKVKLLKLQAVENDIKKSGITWLWLGTAYGWGTRLSIVTASPSLNDCLSGTRFPAKETGKDSMFWLQEVPGESASYLLQALLSITKCH